jgi:NAD(P)H-hydrate epimerase
LRPLSRKESREVDRRASESLRIPSICLMENAGAEAARIALQMPSGPGTRVVCVCGPGGNGGDARVVARHLAIVGVDVELATFGPAPVGDAGVQAAVCAAMGLRSSEILDSTGAARVFAAASAPTLIVDGLYGTGLTRALDGVAASLVAAMNASGAPVLALDVPSGLDCDSGEPLGPCVRAAVTVTFVAEKIGFSNPASRAFTGDVRVVGIGAPGQWPIRG